MNHIRILEAFQSKGKEFRFPEDFHIFLDKKIPVYVAVELAPECFEMSAVDSKILENTIIANKKKSFNVGYVHEDPTRLDPWEWSLASAKIESIWMEKDDLEVLFSAAGQVKVSKPGAKSDNQTIMILSAAIQTLSNELIDHKVPSNLLKEVKGSHSINIDNLVKAIEDHAHRWWDIDAGGKPPMGMGSRNIKDKISAAIKFSAKAE